MSEFVYCIEVSFLGDQCLGKDLAALLEIIPNLSDGEWCLFDVQTNDYESNLEVVQRKLKNHELIDYSMHVDQFFSGVFLYFSNQCQCAKRKNLLINTEDEKYRNPLNASLEIRAFDTTFFEIYSSEQDQINLIKKKLEQNNIDFVFESSI